MGLFGKKDFTKINEQNKKNILSQIEGIKLNVRGDSQVMQLLAKLSSELQSQTASKEKAVAEIDINIVKYLKEANEAIVKGANVIAVNKLDVVGGLLNSRRVYCQVGGHLSKEQQAAQAALDKANKKILKHQEKDVEIPVPQQLQDMIDKKSMERDALQAQFERLKERNAKTPGDPSIISQGQTLKLQINSLNKDIYELGIKKTKAEQRLEIQNKVNFSKSLDSMVGVDDNQNEINIEAMKLIEEKNQEDLSEIESNNELLKSNLGLAMADPFAETVEGSLANPFEDEKAESTIFDKKAFDKNMLGTQEMRVEIAKTKAALEKSVEKYSDKIDDANDELNDLNEQLKPLLIKRKTSSASERLALDGQIDQLLAKRNGVQYSIKRYRQGAAVLQEQLLLMDKLSTQQDLEATQAQIDMLTEGKFKDFEGLAMYLKESVTKSNEKLEEIGMAGMVADSEEINTNTFASISTAVFDSNQSNDDNKYETEEKDLGLMI